MKHAAQKLYKRYETSVRVIMCAMYDAHAMLIKKKVDKFKSELLVLKVRKQKFIESCEEEAMIAANSILTYVTFSGNHILCRKIEISISLRFV